MSDYDQAAEAAMEIIERAPGKSVLVSFGSGGLSVSPGMTDSPESPLITAFGNKSELSAILASFLFWRGDIEVSALMSACGNYEFWIH